MSGSVLLDHGPITMTLEALCAGVPLPEAAGAGARAVLRAFGELVDSEAYMAVMRTYIGRDPRGDVDRYPGILQEMIASVSVLDEPDFTPLAAVAGTMSDLAVRSMIEAGADYAIANNGGDIAYRLPEGKDSLKVGLISDLKTAAVTHLLEIPRESGVCGIATSGLGGRSFTRGVASAVTALGVTASLADAAATSIANACDCDDPCVERCLAGEIDPQSDIADLTITRTVGALCEQSAEEALSEGAKRAEELCERGVILGAIIFVSGKMALRWAKKINGSDKIENQCPFVIKPRNVI